MKIFLKERGFVIEDLSAGDVRSLLRMIKSACLNERRDFNNLKEQIETLDKQGLIDK